MCNLRFLQVPNFLAIAAVYMQIRRRVGTMCTGSAVADAKKRLMAVLRMVGFITTLHTQAGLGESSVLGRAGAQRREDCSRRR